VIPYEMKRLITNIIFLLVMLPAGAQDISFLTEFPSVVEAGQQFSIMWKINDGPGKFTAPPFEGFYKLMGPQQSSSEYTGLIGGKVTREKSYTYVYYLQALKEGKYVIPPAQFTIKNNTYVSDSMRIEVIGSNAQKQRESQDVGDEKDQDQEGTVSGDGDVFVNLSLSRRDVYLGEHITATVKLYTRVNLSGINEIKYPSFTGFLKTDIETPPLTSLKQENLNGTIYGTGVIQQFLLFPQQTGEILIDPVQISVLIQQRSGRSDPFFGDFFSTYQTIPRAVLSKPVKINIKPLPGTRPDGFSGFVGKLNLKAGIDKDSVNVNDAVSLKITISGSGNLKLAGAPVLKLSPDLEIYDPKITDNIKNTISGSSGQRTFEYLLIPRHYGDFTIPALTYSYFNPASGRYEKLTSEELRFHARRGTGQSSDLTVYGSMSKEDVKYLGKDIRFIKSDPGRLRKQGNILVKNRTYYSGFAATLLVFFTVLIIRREHVRRNSDLSAVRNRRAAKMAAKRLHEASLCMKRGENDRFYEEILKSLWGYISDKLNIPVSELTRTNALAALGERGIDDEKLKSLASILDTCEFARYAPSPSAKDTATIYEEASGFIRSVENSIG
jgi:hypothetical protein